MAFTEMVRNLLGYTMSETIKSDEGLSISNMELGYKILSLFFITIWTIFLFIFN